jgi:Domain of unknown function (DUF1707)
MTNEPSPPTAGAHLATSTTAGDVRVSDRERREAAERLSAHAAAGRLTIEELEARVERVQTAVFAGDLVPLEADLPASAPAGRRRGHPAQLSVLAWVGLAAVFASVLVGHPVAPLFIAAVLLWRIRRRPPRIHQLPERSLR